MINSNGEAKKLIEKLQRSAISSPVAMPQALTFRPFGAFRDFLNSFLKLS
jgi:hypothetical protein